jgi:ABC-type Zn uptake system ZnuABC Zn-binding protein ZnuA
VEEKSVKKSVHTLLSRLLVVALLAMPLVGCRPQPTEAHERDEMPALSAVPLDEGEKLRVVATTSIVADVVHNVGGDLIELQALVPRGTDPHTFEPTPQDATALAEAHVLFSNGVGLEEFLPNLLDSAGESVIDVPLSYGVELIELDAGQDHQDEGDELHHHEGADPHTWFDPHNVIIWVHNVEHALSLLDGRNAARYQENAAAYEARLQELDAWIRAQLAAVPPGRRRLVTDHTSFGNLARQYGFEQIGAVMPGYSTLSEPSARDLAALQDAMRQFDVRAIFVGLTVNPDLAERIAADTGAELVFLYTGSLSGPGGPADSYISLIQYDVSAIAEALR